VPSDRVDPIGPAPRAVDPVRAPLLTPLEREAERRRREQAREERRRRERRDPEPREPGEEEPRPRLDVRG
jgi:hypothetical protein